MKKVFFIGLISLVFVFGFTTIQTDVVIDKKALTSSCKKKLDPFQYDSQKFTKIISTKKNQQLEVEVPVFIGEKYRVVFNTSQMNKPINIKIYTKDKESNKREPIFTNKDFNKNETEFIFDAPRVRKMFIDYEVPKDSANQALNGVVVFMIGYK